MDLLLCGSNRNNNCYTILNSLKKEEDEIFLLKNKEIKYCLACNSCAKELENHCIIDDDMKRLYKLMINADKIIIATPIYFNQITGILKNVIDRLRPFGKHGTLKNKKVYLITVGSLSEEENKPVENNINNYFKELADIFEFEFTYLRNFTSDRNDKIEDNYDNYNEIIEDIRSKI